MRTLLAGPLALAASDAAGGEQLKLCQTEVLGAGTGAGGGGGRDLPEHGSIASLWVLVPDDGTRREAFSERICRAIAGHVDTIVFIRVFDAAAMKRGDRVELGRKTCTF